jgi:hypothetical protein
MARLGLEEERSEGIIIATLRQDRSPWVTIGLPQRTAEEFGLSVVTFEGTVSTERLPPQIVPTLSG